MNKDIVNYYAALDIEDENADETVIKKSYRKLVLKWHPDKHPEDRQLAEERIREINNAYEILSNPTKRATYDQQRRAVKRRHTGFGPPQTTSSPRMRIPKEFMMMPIGAPDKFIRYQGSRCFVHSRQDVKDVGFKAFFEDTRWSLWWLPEVNNMCRIRAQGSRAVGERSGVGAGLCGGLNLSFNIDPMNPTHSVVCLEEAQKGQKMDRVNFIATTSPAYEGAFRFEAAFRKGYYLVFLPPNHCRVAPFGEEDDAGVADFSLVDFNIMYRFIEIHEVIQPVVAASSGLMPLEALRKDANVLAYFQNILQRQVWDNDDFITYFEGHWETWEYLKDQAAVRLRTPDEKLAQLLMKSQDADDTSSIIASTTGELAKLPLAAAGKALLVLAKANDTIGLDVTKAINRVSAQKKLLSNLAGILANAIQSGTMKLPLKDMLDFIDLIMQVGGANPAADLQHTRREAHKSITEICFQQLEAGGTKVEPIFFSRILCLPGAKENDETLRLVYEPFISDLPMESCLEVVKNAGTAGCIEVANMFATAVLSMLDATQPEACSQESMRILIALSEAGAISEDVARRLQALAPTVPAQSLAAAVLALGKKGFVSDALEATAKALGQNSDLGSVGPSCLLELAVTATKSASLLPLVSAAAQHATVSGRSWQLTDLVRLLLVVAKAKDSLAQADKAELLRSAAVVVTPELGSLPASDLIKLILAIAGDGCSELMIAAGEEAVERRISSFPAAQLMLVTQGLFQGLGSSHKLVKKLVDFWIESFKDGNAGDSDDEVNKRRRELEQKSKLSADHLVQLAKITSAGGSAELMEAIGSKLLSCAKDLTESGKKALDSQVSSAEGLGLFSKLERLKRMTSANSRSRSTSRKRSSSPRKRKDKSYSPPPRRDKSYSPPRKRSNSRNRKKSPSQSRNRRKSRSRSRRGGDSRKDRKTDQKRKKSSSRSRSRSRRRSRSRKKKSRSRSRRRR